VTPPEIARVRAEFPAVAPRRADLAWAFILTVENVMDTSDKKPPGRELRPDEIPATRGGNQDPSPDAPPESQPSPTGSPFLRDVADWSNP